jgi:hypothetical protein
LPHRGVETLARAYVLAFDVDVHERREVVVLDELRAQRGEPRDQIVEQLAHRRAVGLDLALAADLGSQRGWNANDAQAGSRVPAQNST